MTLMASWLENVLLSKKLELEEQLKKVKGE